MTCSCHAPIAPSSRWWDDSIKRIPGITGFKALKQTNLVLHWEFERWGYKTLFGMTLLLCSAQVSYTHLPLSAMTVREISVPMDRYERCVQCYFLVVFQLVTVILFQLMKGLRKQITFKETNCIYSNGKIKQTIKKMSLLHDCVDWLILHFVSLPDGVSSSNLQQCPFLKDFYSEVTVTLVYHYLGWKIRMFSKNMSIPFKC